MTSPNPEILQSARISFFNDIRIDLAPLLSEAKVELDNSDIIRFLLFAPNLLILTRGQAAELVETFNYSILDHQILDALDNRSQTGIRDYANNEKNLTQLARFLLSQAINYDEPIIKALRRFQEKEALFQDLLVMLTANPNFCLRKHLLWQSWHFDNVLLGFQKRNEAEVLELISRFYVLTSSELAYFANLFELLKAKLEEKKLPLLKNLTPSALISFLIQFPAYYLAQSSSLEVIFQPSYLGELVLFKVLDFLPFTKNGEKTSEIENNFIRNESNNLNAAIWEELSQKEKEACFDIIHTLISEHKKLEELIHKLTDKTGFSIALLIYSQIINSRYDREGNHRFSEEELYKVLYKIGALRDEEKKIAASLIEEIKYHLKDALDCAPFPLKNSEIISLVLVSPLLIVFETDRTIDYEESLVLKKFARVFLEEQPFLVFDPTYNYEKYSLQQAKALANYALELTQNIEKYQKGFYHSLQLLKKNHDFFNQLPIFQLQGWDYFSINNYIMDILQEFKSLDLEYGYREERKIQEILVNTTYLSQGQISHIRNLFERLHALVSAYTQERNIELTHSTLLRMLLFTPIFEFISIDNKIDYEEAKILNDFVLTFSNDLYLEVFTLEDSDRIFKVSQEREDFLLNEFEYLASHWRKVEPGFLAAYQYLLKNRSFIENIIKEVMNWEKYSIFDITINLIETARLQKWEAAADDEVIDSISLKIINRIITQSIGKVFMEELRATLASYLNSRELKLKNAELIALVLMSPMLLIINSDQIIDTFEEKFLKTQASSLNETIALFHFLNEEYTQKSASALESAKLILEKEILYLAYHIHKYEAAFIAALKKIIENKKSVVHFIDPTALPKNYKVDNGDTLIDNMLYIMHWVLYNNFGDNLVEEAKINAIMQKLGLIE
jgi:hypothetical protein